jgi:hypothetical protein
MQLTDFQRIVVMNTLMGIGTGLVGIFIPIYLLQLGFSLKMVITWLIVHHASLLLGAFASVFVSNIIGLVRGWYIRGILATLLFGGLYLIPGHHSLIFLLGFISGMESAFFWIPYNILTVRKTDHKNIGSSLALMSNVGSIVGIGIPLIAALIITHYGYPVLFFLALFFILISLIPVIPLSHEKTHFEFSRKAIAEIVRKNRNFILPEILDNLGQDAGVIWFLFIFTTGLTILDIGFLGVISSVVGIVVTHLTGHLIDNWNNQKVIRFGAVATTITWVASYFVAVYVPTPIMLYIATVLRGFAIGIFAMSYGSVMFNKARDADAQFLVLREVPTIFGRIVVFAAAIILISLGHFELTFLMVALLSLYFWFNNLEKLKV